MRPLSCKGSFTVSIFALPVVYLFAHVEDKFFPAEVPKT